MGDTDNDVTTDDQNPDEPDELDFEDEQDGDTFPREYVEKLRKESKGYRERAKNAEGSLDTSLRELFALKVERNGKLADPQDLPFSAELLTDDDALDTAINELISKHPHYGKKNISGSVGQGVTSDKAQPFSLMGRLSQSV